MDLLTEGSPGSSNLVIMTNHKKVKKNLVAF